MHLNKFCSNKLICVSCHIMVATSYFAALTKLKHCGGLNVLFACSDMFTPGMPKPLKGPNTWLFLKSQYFRNGCISGYFSAIFSNAAYPALYCATVVASQSAVVYFSKFSLSSIPTLLIWLRTSDLKCHWHPRTHAIL